MGRTKRVFISDIHLGDERSMTTANPYCWFNKNIPILAHFLNDQLKSPDVKEVIILGDLFDEWVIPIDVDPLVSIDTICCNPINKLVIDRLKDLATSPDVKLSYVPGNHDMSMKDSGIWETRQFMETTFPGIKFICSSTVPLGSFVVGPLVAEHGARYCLFNSPDTWTVTDSCLPLGYFISRMVASKVSNTGKRESSICILMNFVKEFMSSQDFVKDMFTSIAEDAGLALGDRFKLAGIAGYPDTLTIADVSNRFGNLVCNWEKTSGKIDIATAMISDAGNLQFAATKTYFHAGSDTNIVIFGHTHAPIMNKFYLYEPGHGGGYMHNVPCRQIYANSGTWVDDSDKGCTYVETEEVRGEQRHYVRLKSYPGNDCLDEGYVNT